MREFIEALFEKENKIEFQYEDYEMSFFAGRFKSYYHKGMIPLLHAISKADTNALPKIIKYMKSKKYEFRTLDTIKIKNKVS